MRKIVRRLVVAVVLTVLTSGSVLVASSPARADQNQPRRSITSYAIEQTQLLFAGLDAKTAGLSPRTCKDSNGSGEGVKFLPVNWNGKGDASVSCKVGSGEGLILDFGGTVAWEDPPACAGAFNRDQLVQILTDYFPPSRVTSTATLDRNPINPEGLITPVFTVSVNQSYTEPLSCGMSLWEESKALGHAGTLAAAYSGKKAHIAPLSKGQHRIVLSYSAPDVSPRTLTYIITVE